MRHSEIFTGTISEEKMLATTLERLTKRTQPEWLAKKVYSLLKIKPLSGNKQKTYSRAKNN